MKTPISRRILISITGSKKSDWQNKLLEIEEFNLRRIALFLEIFSKKQRKEIYNALLSSKIKNIPIVHIKNEMDKSELKFLQENYNSKCFTIHEDSFQYLSKWEGFHNKLFLEFNYDNHLSQLVHVEKIGGLCVDLSHFKASQERFSKDFIYIMSKRKTNRYFKCNHLNGYSDYRKRDLHTIKSLKDFDYLKTLPKFVFGKYIALETFNSIKEQLRFKEYLCKILKDKV